MSVRDVIQAAAGAAGGVEKTFVEDVFQTYLYTGNGSTQTINNGIDLAGKGGLVWSKIRSSAGDHCLNDSARNSFKNRLVSNSTSSQDVDFSTSIEGVTSALSNGFVFKSFYSSPTTYVSWTFRKAPKFFDVVTYTGNGGSNRAIPHSLGTTPGMIIVKCTSTSDNWTVWHRYNNNKFGILNLTDQFYDDNGSTFGGTSYPPTSSSFYINSALNVSGQTYVAYLFAHDTTTDGLIQCGSFTTGTNRNFSVNLGWEPQFLLAKKVNATEDWQLIDNLRRWSVGSGFEYLVPNGSSAEFNNSASYPVLPTATGFEQTGSSGAFNGTYIYMAIRRGPMRTPTDGTKVFSATTASTEPSTTPLYSGGDFPADMVLHRPRKTLTSYGFYICDRLRGNFNRLSTSGTGAEQSLSDPNYWKFDNSTGAYIPSSGYFNNNGEGSIGYALGAFRRAPGFFDVVCYKGTGSASESIKHNLGVAPNLILIKCRSTAGYEWVVYNSALGSSKKLYLNTTDAELPDFGTFGGLTPTATTFGVGNNATNASAQTFVAYLFASCPGVSKVGSYTGNGSSQTINCGFTNGARFVLIKRTDSTGDWYVWDTARGIVNGTDPSLLLNSTAAEVATNDAIDPRASGFDLDTGAVNISGATYIYLAIA